MFQCYSILFNFSVSGKIKSEFAILANIEKYIKLKSRLNTLMKKFLQPFIIGLDKYSCEVTQSKNYCLHLSHV